MRFFRRVNAVPGGEPLRVGVLAGSFNPPTVAHFHLLEAAAGHVDELVCVVPRVLPHKIYHGASLEQRVEMLTAPGLRPDYSVAVSDGGLIAEIAGECRGEYGETARLLFLCGRDAAERIVGWKYEREEMLAEMFQQFSLLVARRQGEYVAPDHLAGRIRCLEIAEGWDSVSATEVRQRIASGAGWRDLVPDSIESEILRLYATSPE